MDIINITNNNKIYFGGDQSWFAKKSEQDYGCGIIACANIVFSINKILDSSAPETVAYNEYMSIANELSSKYFKILPNLGINGFVLSFGFNRYLKKNNYKYKSKWGVLPSNLWKKINEMLSEGLPVLLAIGPHTLPFFKKEKLPLYQFVNGKLSPVYKTKSHYVMITEIHGNIITISSWGEKYFIKKDEFVGYVKKYSNYLFSNILYIKKTN